jgi:hypothetical protein
MKQFAILFCFSLACAGQTATSAKAVSALDQELIANSKAVFQAEKTKDVDALKRLFADHFKQVGSDGKLNDPGDVLDDAKDGKLQDYRVYDAEVLPISDTAAIVTYDAIIHVSEGDEPGMAPRYQHFSDLWVKQGDEWCLQFRQATAVRHID